MDDEGCHTFNPWIKGLRVIFKGCISSENRRKCYSHPSTVSEWNAQWEYVLLWYHFHFLRLLANFWPIEIPLTWLVWEIHLPCQSQVCECKYREGGSREGESDFLGLFGFKNLADFCPFMLSSSLQVSNRTYITSNSPQGWDCKDCVNISLNVALIVYTICTGVADWFMLCLDWYVTGTGGVGCWVSGRDLNLSFCLNLYIWINIHIQSFIHSYVHACIHSLTHMQCHTHKQGVSCSFASLTFKHI